MVLPSPHHPSGGRGRSGRSVRELLRRGRARRARESRIDSEGGEMSVIEQDSKSPGV